MSVQSGRPLLDLAPAGDGQWDGTCQARRAPSRVSVAEVARNAAGPARARILSAATALFVSDGYLGTTMAAIAEHSDLAVQSLYLRFGSKLAILKAALDAAVVGDLEPLPLLERPWVKQVEGAKDGRAAVRLFVAETKRIMGRTYPIYAVVLRAAAGEAGELLAENRRQRYEGSLAIAELLSKKAGSVRGPAVTTAADRIFGLVSEDHYGLLVVERGWSPDQWEAWCADLLAGVLFPGA